MPVRKILRRASDLATNPVGGPGWNTVRVDPSTDTFVFGTGSSGTTEKTVVDTTSTQTLTNKTLTSPTITGAVSLSAPVASSSATVTLTSAQSGLTFLMDRASGTQYTLPAPIVGLRFTFINSVLQTTGNNVVVTDAGTTFLTGSVITFSGEHVTPSSTLGPYQFAGNGSSHVKVTTNGTTTGGGIGTWLEFRCISATIWYVTGVVNSPSGSTATPFST